MSIVSIIQQCAPVDLPPTATCDGVALLAESIGNLTVAIESLAGEIATLTMEQRVLEFSINNLEQMFVQITESLGVSIDAKVGR